MIIFVSEGMSQEVVHVAPRTSISLRVAVALADGSRLGFDQYMDTLTEAVQSIEFDTAKFNKGKRALCITCHRHSLVIILSVRH